jgi:hypothetical protein
VRDDANNERSPIVLGWPYGYVGVMVFIAVMMIGILVFPAEALALRRR